MIIDWTNGCYLPCQIPNFLLYFLFLPVVLKVQSCLPAQLSSWLWCICCNETPSPARVSDGRCTLFCTCLLSGCGLQQLGWSLCCSYRFIWKGINIAKTVESGGLSANGRINFTCHDTFDVLSAASFFGWIPDVYLDYSFCRENSGRRIEVRTLRRLIRSQTSLAKTKHTQVCVLVFRSLWLSHGHRGLCLNSVYEANMLIVIPGTLHTTHSHLYRNGTLIWTGRRWDSGDQWKKLRDVYGKGMCLKNK